MNKGYDLSYYWILEEWSREPKPVNYIPQTQSLAESRYGKSSFKEIYEEFVKYKFKTPLEDKKLEDYL